MPFARNTQAHPSAWQWFGFWRWFVFAQPLFWATFASPGWAQTERYELGKRLRRFEVQWQQTDQAQRAASTEPMQKAVQSFFGLRLPQAGHWLDEAYFILRQPSTPTTLERVAIAQRLQISPVCLALEEPNLNLQLVPFYKLEAPNENAPNENGAEVTKAVPSSTNLLQAAVVELAIHDLDGNKCISQQVPGAELISGLKWRLDAVGEGDYLLEPTIRADNEMVRLPPVQVSVVHNAPSRLEAIDSWLKEQSQAPPQRTDQSETIRLTLRQIMQILRSQLAARPLETDYPAARLLRLAESIVAAPSRASDLLQAEAHQSAWLTLSYQRQSLPVRVHMPATTASKANASVSEDKDASQQTARLPVLMAFHGAGGSENMFFETYGAGRLVKLASERGWIVVAPRHPLLGVPLNYRQMLETLSHFYPVDGDRVFLVGHSMGGGEVVRQVSLDARPPQAAVVIGGGGNAKNLNQLMQTPWLVVAGELDFGRSGAKSLQRRLTELGCTAEYREYAAVEHMVIVQAALEDLFRFLDRY